MGYYVQVDQGVQLYVEDLNPNAQKAIVFLHGWPLNYNQFEYQFNMLPANGFRCIGIDWRGFGKSDKPFTGYTFDRLSDDIRAVVERLQLREFILAGHSTGGAIAIRYMSRHQGHGVSKLVLINAAAPTGFSASTSNELLMEMYRDRPHMVRGISETFFFQYITEPFAEWFIQLGLQAASWSTAAIIATLRDESVSKDLADIDVPTLIIHGVHDKVIPFSQAQLVQQSIRNALLVPFQYSGHGTFWEEKDKFNLTVMQFAHSKDL